MHIKRMHDMIEKLTKCTEMEFEKGVENIDTKEMGEVIDMIKDLSEAEYYATITKAMEESEYGEDYDHMGAYDDNSRRGYRGQPRDSRGRYMSRRGRGGRRGYEQPMDYRVPDVYGDDMEMYRDMDRMDGRMYYSGGSSGSSQGGSSQSGNMSGGMSSGQGSNTRNYGGESGNMRDGREGRSGQSRRSYMETKEMHKDNSPESKQAKMKELEKYTKELADDVTEMITDMSPEEKNLLKAKMQSLMQKI